MTTTIIVILVVIVLFVLIYTSGNGTNENEHLRLEYESALLGLDKKAALKAGRLYYASRRKNKELTIYDEQAIANDLSTMPQATYLSRPGNSDIPDTEIQQLPTSTIINY